MSAVLERMTSGFRDPVRGAQQAFRAVLDAMARPGRVVALPRDAFDGVVPPASRSSDRPMSLAATAVPLALLDAETSVDVVGRLASDDVVAYLRFHTGVRRVAAIDGAAFVLACADEVDASLWSRLYLGTDEVPQDGATLVVEVDALGGEGTTRLALRGPGIESEATLGVDGLPDAFWTWRRALTSELPRGLDLVLVHGTSIAALPRSTRIVGSR